jgi:copper transport protein
MRRAALLAVGVFAALLLPAPPAGAHAFLVRATPAPGSIVRSAPTEVRLVFTEPVRPAAPFDVLTAGHSVVAGRPHIAPGHPNEIVVPLRGNLGAGPYAVRWSEVDIEDGHLIQGAFIFSVGSGLAPAVSLTKAQGSNGAPPSAVISRWLLLAGLLVAAGSVGFTLLVRRERGRSEAILLAVALGVAALGGVLAVVLESGSTGTRYGHWTLIGAGLAAVGAAAAVVPRGWVAAATIAVVLLGLPTATGHADAAGVSHAVSVPADLAHLAAAALWIGGIVDLALVGPRGARGTLARRFAPFALGAVALLGASGIVRAFNELSAARQLWTTSYGQALLVKTGVLAAVLVLAWLNRRRLTSARLAGELALLAVVLGAVAVLTNVRPGRDFAIAAAPTPTSHTVVYAGEDDDLAVGLAVTPRAMRAVALRATVLGFDGPAGGLGLRFGVDSRSAVAAACGGGCYRATIPLAGRPHTISVRISGHGRRPATLRFAAPAQWPAPPGLDIVRTAERVIGGLKTLVVRSTLASDANHEVTTVYKMVAPDRLAYANDDGSGSVIVGNRRWDRQRGGRWVESPQVPKLAQPAPFWAPDVADAHVLRTATLGRRSVWVVSFVNPSTPAWFTAWIDRSSYRTLRLQMVATAHFMHDRDGPFDAPISVEPPDS